MNKGEFYWVNLVNMVEINGPYKTAAAAKNAAIFKFPDPPDNGKNQYAVGVAIVQVTEVGEVVVSAKGEWRS